MLKIGKKYKVISCTEVEKRMIIQKKHNGFRDKKTGLWFDDSMRKFCGNIIKIAAIDKNGFGTSDDAYGWYWCENFFEKNNSLEII